MRRAGWILLATVLTAAACSPPRSVVALSLLDRLDTATLVAPEGELEPIAVRNVVVAGEERAALLSHAPSEVIFEIEVPAEARLEVGVGIADRGLAGFAQSDGVAASIWLEAEGVERQTLWSAELPGTPAPWSELSIPLDEWSGRSVRLGFASANRANPAGDFTAWSRPRLVAPGASVVAPPPEIAALRIERDLLDDPALETDGCRVRIPEVTIPADGVLDVTIQALRDPDRRRGFLGPMRVELSIDGRSVFRRVAGSFGDDVTVPGQVDVSAFAGQRVSVGLDVCDELNANSLVWSKRLWLGSRASVARAGSDAGPNLLFLLVDTVRADRLGHHGYERATSPNWDRLAETSRVYERVVAPSSWTQPSVTSLFTGQSPIEHGVIEGVALPVRAALLSEVLQRDGFTTLGISANPIVGPLEGFHRGFERFVSAPWIRADELNLLFSDWLDRNADRRWFAYLHYIDPHAPYGAPEPQGSAFTDGCSSEWASEAGMNELSETINFDRGRAAWSDADIDCLSDLYDGEIRFWDAQLGRLLESLERRGELDDTLIVITSDHGEEFNEHGHVLHGYNLYEETVHVPLTVRLPGQSRGSRTPDVVSLQELSEALYHLLGVRGGAMPRLLEPGDPVPIFAHTTEAWIDGTGFTALASVREQQLKYIYRPEDGREELYDLESDPLELSDRVGEGLPEQASLAERLTAWLSGARPQTMQTRGMDEATVEKLRSLGYVK